MMTTDLWSRGDRDWYLAEKRSEYKRLRKLGFRAEQAFNAAIINARFATIEDDGAVSISVEPDPEPYDDSYIDEWNDCSENERAQYRRSTAQRIEQDGVWGIVSSYYCTGTEQMETLDCVWGFIGEDWCDSGYDVDMKAAALDVYLNGHE